MTVSVLCLLCSLACREFADRGQQVLHEGSDFADRRKTE